MHCPWKPKKHLLWNRWIHIHSVKQALKRYRAAVQFKMWLAVSYLMALYSSAPREVDMYGDRGGTAWRKWRFCKLFGSQGILSEESLIWGKFHIFSALMLHYKSKRQERHKGCQNLWNFKEDCQYYNMEWGRWDKTIIRNWEDDI